MLTILITPNTLVFKELTDTACKDLKEQFYLKFDGDEYYIEEPPAVLFKVLLTLAYKYDIEIV